MKALGLFFTKGISVEHWYKSGLLDREKLIYEEFLKKGLFDKIYWFTYGDGDKKYEKKVMNGIEIIPKPAFFAGSIGNFFYSLLLPFIQRRYIKKCNFLKTNQMKGSVTAIASKLIYKKILVLRTGYTCSKNDLESGNTFSYFKDWMIEKLGYKLSNIAIVSSESQKKYLEKNHNIDIRVVSNYVDTDLFKPINKKKSKDVVFVGRLHPEKNIFSLIDAITKTNFNLDIYGQGDLKSELQKKIRYLKKENQIKLCGVVSNNELPKILNKYEIYILSSFYEGNPKTLLESMSCGLCCVGTNVPGINEIIKHDKNGWLAGPTEESIRRATISLMRDFKKRKRLGENARKYILQNFSLNKVANKEIKIYEELSNDRNNK